jgi:hypothetical protein
MKLLLIRKWATTECTVGTLDVDGQHICYILEDVEREVKVPRKTAIPRGTYNIVIDYSNRFQRRLPHLLNVPNFTGIRIHPGNYAGDTEGCLLPGQDHHENMVGHSQIAFSNLFGMLLGAEGRGEPMTIEIQGALIKAIG